MADLSVGDVRTWTEDRFYDRGERYFRQGRIRQAKRIVGTTGEGVRLKALCEGSRAEPYRLEAVVNDGDVQRATCSCPAGPRCKHLVALLLTWIDDPDAFAESESLRSRLLDQPKESLVGLIEEMIQRFPSLESVADLAATEVGEDTDTATIRSYVRRAIEAAGDGGYDSGYSWGVRASIAREIEPIFNRARSLLDADRPADAHTVLDTVATTVINAYDGVYDREGHLMMVTQDCASLLGEVLDSAQDVGLRRSILETLYGLYRWDVDLGGMDAAYPAGDLFRNRTTPEEREAVAEWIRDDLENLADAPPPEPDSHFSMSSYDPTSWERGVLGEMYLDLVGEELDEEAYLDLCRLAGLTVRRAQHLVNRGRFDEAVQVAEAANNFELPGLLDDMAEAGAGDAARTLARQRIDDEHPPLRVVRWLYDDAMERGDHTEALDTARTIFDQRPGPEPFDLVRAAARPLGREAELETEMLDALQTGHHFAALARVALHAGDLDRAIDAAWGAVRHNPRGGDSVAVRVAEHASDEHPDAAVDLFDAAARLVIDHRGRDNYRVAADYFTQARAVLDRHDRLDEFQDRIDALVEDELRSLPAARDEFEKKELL
jgi:tetratricopeptide (TPR) repeat protein